MNREYIKKSTFINRLLLQVSFLLVPIVLLAIQLGFLRDFIISKSNVTYHFFGPISTNVPALNDSISSQRKKSSDLYDKKINFEKKFYSTEKISTDLKSQNPKNLLEIYLFFADSFREAQMKYMVKGIARFQENSFQKMSPVFICENKMENLSLYQNNKDSQSSLDFSTHPAAREIAILSDSSLKTKTEKSSSKYSVLVGLGPSVEFQNSIIVSEPARVDFLQKMADLLRQLIAIQKNEVNLNLLNESYSALGQEFLKYLNIALAPARLFYGIENFTFTRFAPGNLLEHLETKSGLTGMTKNPRRPYIPLTLDRLTHFCEISNLPVETAGEYKTQIASFQKLRYFFTQIEKNQGVLNQANLSVNFQESLTTINDLLQTDQNQVQSLCILKSQSVGLNLKAYFRAIPVLEMNPVFAYNLHTKDLSLGLGKAYFNSFPQFENVGLLTGLDVGFAINSRSKLFQGVKISGFVGLGISF